MFTSKKKSTKAGGPAPELGTLFEIPATFLGDEIDTPERLCRALKLHGLRRGRIFDMDAVKNPSHVTETVNQVRVVHPIRVDRSYSTISFVEMGESYS